MTTLRSCGDALDDWHAREEEMNLEMCEWCFRDESEIDSLWTKKLKAWKNRDGDLEMLCPDCLADAREADRAKGRQPWE